jgi:four helix bundle protein
LVRINSFEELPVWQIARKFTNDIYILTNRFPKDELFGLTSQIRRAAVSIGSNIAEGFDRRTDKELTNFLSMARGSCAEIQNDLYISLDQKYITEIEFQKYYRDTKKIAQQLNGLMNYLRKT